MESIFRSSRLIYRTLEKNDEDTTTLHNLRLDPQILIQTGARRLIRPQSRADTEELAKILYTGQLLSVFVCIPSTDSSDTAKTASKVIGYMHCTDPGPQFSKNRCTMIGLFISDEERGKGYGSEAINWVLGWAFRIAGLHRVDIGALSFNTGAVKLYERLGFVLEGRKREAVWWDDGWHDLIDFGMLEGEWRERTKKIAGITAAQSSN